MSSLSLTWAGAFELVAELSISYKAQLVLTVIHKACYQPEFFVHDKNLCKSSAEPEDFGPGNVRAFEAEPGLVALPVLSRRGRDKIGDDASTEIIRLFHSQFLKTRSSNTVPIDTEVIGWKLFNVYYQLVCSGELSTYLDGKTRILRNLNEITEQY